MFYSIKDREYGKFRRTSFTTKSIDELRLQDKHGKQNIHEKTKKLFEPVTESIIDVSQGISKTITETSIKNNQAISHLNEKVLELMNDKGMVAPYLASSLVFLFKPENKSQSIRSMKDHNSIIIQLG